MSQGGTRGQPSPWLGIYLNDHLIGATGGLELCRRAATSSRGPARAQLEQLTAQLEQDRESLLALMHALDLPVRRYKILIGWAAEKIARIKTNGRLLRRSPLSDLVELESLTLGVHGKAAGFRALRQALVMSEDSRVNTADLDQLIERADHQATMLERLRLQAASRVLDPGS
jgi:hypothetical protein